MTLFFLKYGLAYIRKKFFVGSTSEHPPIKIVDRSAKAGRFAVSRLM